MELRLSEGELSGCWIVDPSKVNMADFTQGGGIEGRILRVMDMGAIRYIPAITDNYERIAGMVSDAA